MATNVILPALGMSQETGKIVQWLKAEGDQVTKGDPLAEIETDKATVEIEAPATGILANLMAAGDTVPVGQVIAIIQTPNEKLSKEYTPPTPVLTGALTQNGVALSLSDSRTIGVPISLLASRIATEHNLDLSQVQPVGKRIQKADVLAYLQGREKAGTSLNGTRLTLASPKARRLAAEQGKGLQTIRGSGPGGAVLAADILAAPLPVEARQPPDPAATVVMAQKAPESDPPVNTIWRLMAERTTQSWTNVPHFFLVREVHAGRIIAWREQTLKRSSTVKITYTDLLVKIVATALREHPRLNVSWQNGKMIAKKEPGVGLAIAVEDGLVVPIIHKADQLSLNEIAYQRSDLVTRAQTNKLRPQDFAGGSFTISNLGMYGVDAFLAIINQPQAAILAVGRIAERIVPMHGQPVVQPMMTLTLSCDHRVIDGARGAQFLTTLADLIEEPLGLIG